MACGSSEPGDASGTPTGSGTAAVVCDLGTMYPGVSTIDPDAPVFQDATHTQAEVTADFEQAKAAGSMAYLAYKAARDHADVLDCAFCACGCADSIGHLSAIDCFKDMHGFG